VDERAHHTFYQRVVRLFLELDRPATLEQLRRVLNNFSMPSLCLLADSRQRTADIRALNIFNEEIFFRDVYYPILKSLGVQRAEMRPRAPRKSALTEG